TGWTESSATALTATNPPTVRTRLPGLRSWAIVQPSPALQKRWMPVATTVPAPRVIWNVSSGGSWETARTG
ncbi:MAG: hypothetical protein JO329_19130, partial [Planctomycetaceae bacterium]|nr:hypothetical protein [Planctomycetaceae bacterium]